MQAKRKTQEHTDEFEFNSSLNVLNFPPFTKTRTAFRKTTKNIDGTGSFASSFSPLFPVPFPSFLSKLDELELQFADTGLQRGCDIDLRRAWPEQRPDSAEGPRRCIHAVRKEMVAFT